jgi:hypothetical protein
MNKTTSKEYEVVFSFLFAADYIMIKGKFNLRLSIGFLLLTSC